MRYRAQVPTHSFAFVGAEKATAAPGVARGHRDADVVLLAPSNPVVSIGAILAVPGIRGALRSTTARVIGYSPIIGGKPLRGMADECLSVIGVASTSEAVGGYYGARSGTGILDGWLVHEGDHAEIDGVEVRSVPLLMTDPAATAEMVRAGLDLAGVEDVTAHVTTPTEHGDRGASVEMLPVPGLPEFRPGDDLAAALAAAAPWLRDGDVVVVTSKVVSKCEGRIVAAPDRSGGTGRVAAQADRCRGGAGAGPQGPHADHRERAGPGAGRGRGRRLQRRLSANWRCCRPTRTPAPRRCGPALRDRLGVTVGVVITDTMGRAWRNGQTDVAIGAAGLTVLHGYAGVAGPARQRTDRHRDRRRRRDRRRGRSGQGQADRHPGGGGARTHVVRRRIQCTRPAAARRGGPVLAGHRGGPRRWAAARRSCCAARCAGSPPNPSRPNSSRPRSPKRSPRPRHTTPGRCGSCGCRTRERRTALLDRMREQWRADLTATASPPDAVERRVGRGQILYDAPEVVIPFMVPDGAHSYPDAGTHRRRAHHVHRRGRRRRAGAAGRAGRARGGQLLDRIDHLRRRPGARRTRRCRPTGNRWAPSRSATRDEADAAAPRSACRHRRPAGPHDERARLGRRRC